MRRIIKLQLNSLYGIFGIGSHINPYIDDCIRNRKEQQMSETRIWTTHEVFKELGRMCDSFGGCNDCPITALKREYKCNCQKAIGKDPKKAIESIVAWSIKHPEKTLLSDFLEKYPKGALDDDDGTPRTICPYQLGYERHEDRPCRFNSSSDCLKCWSRPLED